MTTEHKEDSRTSAARRRHQYEVEKKLAQKIWNSSPTQRRHLYKEVYDELFRRVPYHHHLSPQGPQDARRTHWRELALLGRYLTTNSVFVELGAGNCAIALAVADHVAQAVVIEVSAYAVPTANRPLNFSALLSDGFSLPVANCAVDLVFSNQVAEHLHPDDLYHQFTEVHRMLRPGGRFVCLTPHRFTGPHDISRFFDEQTAGLHLKEYVASELFDLLKQAGFTRVHQLVGAKGIYRPVPTIPVQAVEWMLQRLPPRLRRRIAGVHGLRMAFDRLMVTATK